MKKSVLVLLALAMLTVLAACNGGNEEKVTVGYLERTEIEDVTLEAWRENAENGNANNHFPAGFEEAQYPSLNEMLLALENDKISFFNTTLNTAKYVCDQNESMSYFKSDKRYFYKMAMLEENRDLCDKINGAITGIKNSTELFDLMNTYITNYAAAPATKAEADPDLPTYKVGVTGNVPPLDYIAADGTPGGFNVAILNLIGEKIGVNFEFVSVENNVRTTALTTGVIDIIFCESVTEQSDLSEYLFDNRKLILTDYYYSDADAFVTKDYPIKSIREIYGIQETGITAFDDLSGKNIGVMAGSFEERLAREKFPESNIVPLLKTELYSYQTMLANGTLDAIVQDRNILKNIENITVLDEVLATVDCNIVLAKDRTQLQSAMNGVLAGFAEDGTIDKLKEKWFNADDYTNIKVEADTDYEAPNGTLKYVVSRNSIPYEYYDEGWKGYEYELMLTVCKELGYGLELVPFEGVEAFYTAMANGEADFDTNVQYTEERAEKFLFVDEYLSTDLVVCVYDD